MGNLYWNDADPMENRIRQTLREWESGSPSDWDSPSDDLWNKIGSEATPPRRNWLFWKWLIPVASVITVAVLLYFLVKPPVVQEIPAEESTPAIVEKQVPAEIDAEHTHTTTAKKLNDTSGNLPTKKSTVSLRKNKLKTGGLTPATTVQNSDINVSGLLQKATVGGGATTGSGGLEAGGNGATPELQAMTPATIAALQDTHLETANNASTQDNTSGRELSPIVPAVKLGEPVSYSVVAPLPLNFGIREGIPAEFSMSLGSTRRAASGSRIFAGLVLTQNLSYRTIQSNRPLNILPPFLRENESAALASEMGIKIGWRASSRFAISGGLGLYNVGLQSMHQLRVPFDPGRENPAGNDSFESNYALSVPSAYGDATVEVGLRRPNQQQVPPGQNINLVMKTNLNLRYISIPVNAYYFLSSGRFSAGLKAGLALNILQKQEFTASAQIMERGLRSRTVTVQPRLEPLEQIIPDLQLGAALWYRPVAGWLISMEPTYRNSLKPAVNREFFSVSQYAMGLQIGVQKIF
jgi:hypothetical protein